MTALGEPSPRAENTKDGREEKTPAPAKPRLFSAGKLKELFGRLAEAFTGKPTPTLAARRKRGEKETNGLFQRALKLLYEAARRRLPVQFRKLAGICERLPPRPAPEQKPSVRRSILENLYAPRPYDPEAERAYAEQVLREQMEEWSQEDEQEPDESFHYAHVAGFDPQP